MHFLLAGRVSWRRLLRPAVAAALLRVGLGVFSSACFSSSVISGSTLYGTIGVVFTLMVWFIAIGAAIVFGPRPAQPGTSARAVPGGAKP